MSFKQQNNLQNDYFNNFNESLVCYLTVTSLPAAFTKKETKKDTKKDNKKRASFFLTLSMKKSPPFQPALCLLTTKPTGNAYKLVVKCSAKWALADLLQCNTHQDSNTLPQIDLSFPSGNFNFVVSSVAEKNEFIDALWQNCVRHLKNKPFFKGYNNSSNNNNFIKNIISAHNENLIGGKKESTESVASDFLVNNLTGVKKNGHEEFKNLISILNRSIGEINMISSFTELLENSLEQTKNESVEQLLSTEHKIRQGIDLLDQCVANVESTEAVIEVFERNITGILFQIKELGTIDAHREIRHNNQELLYNTLSSYISAVDVPSHYISLIDSCSESVEDVDKLIDMGKFFLNGIQFNIPEFVRIIPAFKSSIAYFQECLQRYVRNISEYTIRMYKSLAHVFIVEQAPTEIVITNHFAVYKKLNRFSAIFEQMKFLNASVYNQIYSEYYNAFSAVFSNQFEKLTNICISRINTVSSEYVLQYKDEGKNTLNSLSSTNSGITSVVLDLNLSSTLMSFLSDGINNEKSNANASTNPNTNIMSSIKVTSKEFVANFKMDQHFLNYFERVKNMLNAYYDVIEQAMLKEIKFVDECFHISDRKNTNKKSMLKIKSLISGLFDASLETCFKRLFDSLSKNNQRMIMYALNKNYVMREKYKDTPFSSLMTSIYNISNDYMQNYIKFLRNLIIEYKAPKKIKNYHLVPGHFVFDLYARSWQVIVEPEPVKDPQWEAVIMNMIHMYCKSIERIQLEMGFEVKSSAYVIENFYFVKSVFKNLNGIKEVANYEKELNAKYDKCITECVNILLGEPFKNLVAFFDNIQLSRSRGVKPSEIPFQSMHNKNALERCLANYGVKEVNKICEGVAKSIQKHFNDGVLIALIWASVKDSLVKFFTNFMETLETCYGREFYHWQLNMDQLVSILDGIHI